MNQVCQRPVTVFLSRPFNQEPRAVGRRTPLLLFDSILEMADMQHPAFWGQPMSAEQSFNIHNTFPLPIGASRAEPVSHTQYVQLLRS